MVSCYVIFVFNEIMQRLLTNGFRWLRTYVSFLGDNSETSGSNEKDLNRVSEQTLFQTKATMDVLFEANRVHPGEDSWQYDRQEDFGPAQMESGWDSDSSSTKEF